MFVHWIAYKWDEQFSPYHFFTIIDATEQWVCVRVLAQASECAREWDYIICSTEESNLTAPNSHIEIWKWNLIFIRISLILCIVCVAKCITKTRPCVPLSRTKSIFMIYTKTVHICLTNCNCNWNWNRRLEVLWNIACFDHLSAPSKQFVFFFIWIHKQNYIIPRGIFCDLFIWLHFRQIILKSIKQKHFILFKNIFMFKLKLNSSLFSVFLLKTPEWFMAQYCTINVKYDWMQRWPINRQRLSFIVLHSICNGYFSICFCSFVFFFASFSASLIDDVRWTRTAHNLHGWLNRFRPLERTLNV